VSERKTLTGWTKFWAVAMFSVAALVVSSVALAVSAAMYGVVGYLAWNVFKWLGGSI
jgi:phosphatidylserine decarboxylase